MKMLRKKKGFTLLEVLLVIAIIAVLAAIVIVAINPGKQMGEARNAQRRSDVGTILNAVYQYSIDNNGQIPAGITATATDICRTGASACTGLVDLSTLTASGRYIGAVPNDPSSSDPSAGYQILRDATTGRITVSAPSAEQGATISATR
jgi:type IV pilus assembly protein PilA